MRGRGTHMAIYVDVLAKRYGWTWDYITSMPLRHIESLLKVIEEENRMKKQEMDRAERKAKSK